MPAKTGQGNAPQHAIRGPSKDIWKAAAARAAANGESRNAAIVRLITEYADGKHAPRRRARQTNVGA